MCFCGFTQYSCGVRADKLAVCQYMVLLTHPGPRTGRELWLRSSYASSLCSLQFGQNTGFIHNRSVRVEFEIQAGVEDEPSRYFRYCNLDSSSVCLHSRILQ